MPAKVVYSFSENPSVSVVIPSADGVRGGNVEKLIDCFRGQNFRDLEIVLSVNERPNGHARNVGFAACARSSKYLIFFDDDVEFDDQDMVGKFLVALDRHPEFGLVGAIVRRPVWQDSFFCRWIEYEGGRHVAPKLKEYTESTLVCHAGLGCRRDVWEGLGGESSTIPTGTDTDLRLRMVAAGYKVVLLPDCYVYHPFPNSALEMWRRSWEHGRKHIHFREVHPKVSAEARLPLISGYRMMCWLLVMGMLKLPVHAFVGRSASGCLRFKFRPVYAVNSFVFLSGYLSGWRAAFSRSGGVGKAPTEKPD